jgi:hypothetical protein
MIEHGGVMVLLWFENGGGVIVGQWCCCHGLIMVLV